MLLIYNNVTIIKYFSIAKYLTMNNFIIINIIFCFFCNPKVYKIHYDN